MQRKHYDAIGNIAFVTMSPRFRNNMRMAMRNEGQALNINDATVTDAAMGANIGTTRAHSTPGKAKKSAGSGDDDDGDGPAAGRLFLSVKDVAQRYGTSVNSIWRWARQGDIPAPVKIAPRTTRWPLAALEAHEAAILREGAQ